jgi:2-dehydro-3-deoxygluconokinase
VDKFKKMIIQIIEAYPFFQVVATTPRTLKTASIKDWGAVCWAEGEF